MQLDFINLTVLLQNAASVRMILDLKAAQNSCYRNLRFPQKLGQEKSIEDYLIFA